MQHELKPVPVQSKNSHIHIRNEWLCNINNAKRSNCCFAILSTIAEWSVELLCHSLRYCMVCARSRHECLGQNKIEISRTQLHAAFVYWCARRTRPATNDVHISYTTNNQSFASLCIHTTAVPALSILLSPGAIRNAEHIHCSSVV